MKKISPLGTIFITVWLAGCAVGPGAGPRAELEEGLELLVAKENAAARDHYESMLAEHPENPYVHLNLGVAYQRLGRSDLARQHYEAAIRFGGDAPITRVVEEQGVVSRTGTVAENARRNLASTTELDTPNPPGLNAELEEGWALMVEERYADARNHYEGMLVRYPNNPYAHLNLGVAYQRLGQKDLALQHHRAAITYGDEALARLPTDDTGDKSAPGVKFWREIARPGEDRQTIAAAPKATVAELAQRNLDVLTN